MKVEIDEDRLRDLIKEILYEELERCSTITKVGDRTLTGYITPPPPFDTRKDKHWPPFDPGFNPDL